MSRLVSAQHNYVKETLESLQECWGVLLCKIKIRKQFKFDWSKAGSPVGAVSASFLGVTLCPGLGTCFHSPHWFHLLHVAGGRRRAIGPVHRIQCGYAFFWYIPKCIRMCRGDTFIGQCLFCLLLIYFSLKESELTALFRQS